MLARTVQITICFALASSASAHEQLIAGYVENVWFNDNGIMFQAKLDSGARTASINAVNKETYRRSKQKWVKFSLTNHQGETFFVDAPVKKTILIRRAGARKQRRLVIELPVCLGGKARTTEFTLTDRTGQNYQILIGRKFMSNRILVKSRGRFLLSGRCQPKKQAANE